MEKLQVQENAISKLCLGLEIREEKHNEFRNRLLGIAEKEQISISKRKFLDWAFLVHDYNRMHIFPEYANDEGFKKTPVHGTLIAAYEEQFVLGILNLIKEFNEKIFFYKNHYIKFEKPLFPKLKKARASWSLDDVVVNKEEINLKISAINPKSQEIYMSSKVGICFEERVLNPDYIIDFLSSNDIVEKSNIEIKDGELKSFYYCLNKKFGEEVFRMHPSSFIPATLLRFSSRRTGKPEGTYVSLNFDFYNPPKKGIFETIIRIPKPPREIKREKRVSYLYKFKALCLQDKKPIVGGDIVCISPTQFKI